MDDTIPLGSPHISTAVDLAPICKIQMTIKNVCLQCLYLRGTCVTL